MTCSPIPCPHTVACRPAPKSHALSLWLVVLLPNPMPSHCGLSTCSQIPCCVTVACHSAPKSHALSLWLLALLPNPILCHCDLSPCSQISCPLTVACHPAPKSHALSLWLVTLLPNVFLFCSLTDADSTHSTQFLPLTFIRNNTGKCFVRCKNHKFFC